MYVNRLDPQDFHNWEIAWTRLRAADVIKVREAPVPVQEPKDETPKYIDIEKMPSRTLEERRALRAATLSNLMLESQPTVDAFFADLNAAGHYPTYDERRAMAEYVENHNLFPHQRKSWEKALANVTPKYLSDDERAIRDVDHNDNVTAADLKKALGTASPRVGYAVQNR